jgi:protein-S-isoprenylcysteine O-methyltransferase Ste14
MDIKHENFGFMLAFGDLVWVPMTYTLQALYLVNHRVDLSWPAIVALVLMNLAGLAIFRTVNNQKNTFRLDPDNARIWGQPVKFLQTAQGGKLLLSGFWGWSRHFNYVGDLLMAWAWSLPCGFASPVPYFYPIYFTILLVHRERRDHDLCRQKYGADWDRYCEAVPWRILPGRVLNGGPMSQRHLLVRVGAALACRARPRGVGRRRPGRRRPAHRLLRHGRRRLPGLRADARRSLGRHRRPPRLPRAAPHRHARPMPVTYAFPGRAVSR